MIPSPPTRILYIDDDPGIGRLVQKHLERLGRQVRLATNGEAGIEIARSARFDAIALDHYMPGRDGLSVLADLRSLPEPAPVIFVTAAEEPRIAVAALKAGAADYVVKDLQGTFLDLLDSAIAQAVQGTALRQERDRAEQALRESRDSLEELAAKQSLLLREVNHRVANSLQLISSLLELQARRVAAADARAALHAAAERVEAVSLVHRRLYTSADVSHVEMDQYLAGLVEELQRSVGAQDASCCIRLRADPARIETDKAVAIGLVVNELVTNAAKYAYPGRDGGEVRVDFRKDDDDFTLTVEDDGVGLPPGDATPQGSGLGAVIVAAMARAARATVETVQAQPGTRVTLRLAG